MLGRSWPPRRPALVLGGVATAAAAVVAAIVIAVSGSSSPAPLRFAMVVSGTQLAPGAHGSATLTKMSSGWEIQLSAAGLPHLANGRYYQAWLKNPAGILVPVGTFNDAEHVNADVVGGALTAGKPAIPWAIFRQEEASGSADQVFSRSFANGVWTTRGNGTVGGRSSESPQFPGSLNFDQGQDGEAPAIDFAGAGRTVPWATRYEITTGTGFGENNVFASRFDNTAGDPNQGKWIFAGQSRGNGGSGPDVPSLNIHTNQDAENPVVAGGSAVDPTKPGPWVAWQETSDSNGGRIRSSSASRSAREWRTATASLRPASPTRPGTSRRSAASASRRSASGAREQALRIRA